ncbi:MAG: nucleotidyltransferase domain-containing protein [Deltaproteobacteria bacterium]|jgi:predicted nucleotidyltransferase|nr:nucleotidyltransferase domain-containing protein [Deltaproteobacteria bacterium]
MASEIFTVDGFDGFRTVKTIEIVTAAVRKYADEVRLAFSVVKVYLFGSWAKGTASNRSDVDVCFFLESFNGRSKINVLTDISKLTWNYYWVGIEPHAFEAANLSCGHPFVREILRTGTEIWPGRGSKVA